MELVHPGIIFIKHSVHITYLYLLPVSEQDCAITSHRSGEFMACQKLSVIVGMTSKCFILNGLIAAFNFPVFED